jgi:hypothetical protein
VFREPFPQAQDHSEQQTAMLAALKSLFSDREWPEFTREEVARHNTHDSLWIVAGNRVFDVTNFARLHPAGPMAILKRAGGCKDCTQDYKFHSQGARSQWKRCQVGVLSAEELKKPIPPHAGPAERLLVPATHPTVQATVTNPTPVKVLAEPLTTSPTAPVSPPFVTSGAPPSIGPSTTTAPSPSPRFSTSQVSLASGPNAPDGETEDRDDGGEDCIAAGQCCTGAAPTDACRSCPHAPRCAAQRRGQKEHHGRKATTALNAQVGADAF